MIKRQLRKLGALISSGGHDLPTQKAKLLNTQKILGEHGSIDGCTHAVCHPEKGMGTQKK